MPLQPRSSFQREKQKANLTTPGVDSNIHPIEKLRRFLSTPTLTRAILGRDHGNVFGIWDTAPSDQGSEMLGWGAYVFGSYFNHGMFALDEILSNQY
jgi:SET and MYND domain-containing protein